MNKNHQRIVYSEFKTNTNVQFPRMPTKGKQLSVQLVNSDNEHTSIVTLK